MTKTSTRIKIVKLHHGELKTIRNARRRIILALHNYHLDGKWQYEKHGKVKIDPTDHEDFFDVEIVRFNYGRWPHREAKARIKITRY